MAPVTSSLTTPAHRAEDDELDGGSIGIVDELGCTGVVDELVDADAELAECMAASRRGPREELGRREVATVIGLLGTARQPKRARLTNKKLDRHKRATAPYLYIIHEDEDDEDGDDEDKDKDDDEDEAVPFGQPL